MYGGCTENSLKWFDYPHARAHPGWAVSCHGTEWTCIVGSSVSRWGQPDSGESCIVLQSRPSRSFVAKFPQRSIVACSTWILCCRGRTLRQTRPRMSVCEPLMPNVVSPKVHQNNCSYKLSRPTFGFTTREFSMVGGYMENPAKPQNCQNWGVGACSGMGACSGQYGIGKSVHPVTIRIHDNNCVETVTIGDTSP